MAPEKTQSYHSFLLSKRDAYANHLVRVGSKLMKKGQFNRSAFSKHFFLDKDEIIKKIEQTVKYEIDTQQGIASAPAAAADNGEKRERISKAMCVDSQLIDLLRPHIDDCARELRDVVQGSDCCDESDNESMKTVIECESSGENKKKEKFPDGRDTTVDKVDDDDDDDSHFVTQELMPGECSKIFVQKSRVDIIRSKMNGIDFENDLIETLYIYRR